MSEELQLSPFHEVIADYRAGRMVILVDHVDRENEGDIAIATECITPEAVRFMMHECRGLICVSVQSSVAQRLNLPLQVLTNNSPFQTPFAISIDHHEVAAHGATAKARAHTMRKLLDLNARPDDFVTPGSVFPLIANPSGVIGRQGQTEGSADLARIAGFESSGVICEILNPDGTMARGAQLNEFAAQHGLRITSIAEIIRYRINEEVLVREVGHQQRTLDRGTFSVHVFQDDVAGKEHLALVYGEERLERGDVPLVRVHSECLTGDVFGSRRCDCGPQLDQSLQRIVESGCGVLLYLRQEGRGIGLANKLRAYQLQDDGRDTVQANVELGFAPDERDFVVAAKILSNFGVRQIRLLTNNLRKLQTLELFDIEVLERLPVVAPDDELTRDYLATKRAKLGHLL